jgi:undecaprenyl-diphosphatase
VLGLVVAKLGFALPDHVTPIAIALVVGGLWIFAAEYWSAKRPESERITWTVAILVGLAQIVAAIFPGTSRSAATIFAALLAGTSNRAAATEFAFLVGIAQMIAGIFPGTSRSAATIFAALLAGTSNRAAATEFAFMVGIPTMYAATGYELLKVLKNGGAVHEDWSALIVGFVVSAIVAFAAVKWLLGYIRTHRFTPFAIYRIALGIALLLWLPTGG